MYYEKFPSPLKEALKDSKVQFPNSLEKNYQEFYVYRGIRYKKGIKDCVIKEDFKSQAQRRISTIDYEDVGSYSCSCFGKVEELIAAFHLPRKNKGIAYGIIKKRKWSNNKRYGQFAYTLVFVCGFKSRERFRGV